MLLTGCAGQTADEAQETEQTEEETKETKETQETTNDTKETDNDEIETVDPEDDAEFYGDYDWPLLSDCEGFEEYTVPMPNWEDIDVDSIPDDFTLSDLSTIEDEDIRAIMQAKQDEGFTVDDPALDLQYGYAYGDGENMLANGCTCYRDTAMTFENFAAYKMNESIFENFFAFWADDMNIRTDDGTVIRIGTDECYVEFNRDTQIGTYYMIGNMMQGGVG